VKRVAPPEARSPERMMAITDLTREIKGRLLTDEQSRRERSSDFGRWVHLMAGAVLQPASGDDVAAAVSRARTDGFKVSSRGGAHTQSGQGLNQDGVMIDLGSLNRIHGVDRDALTVKVDAGVVWRDLVEHVLPMGLVPPVLTNNLGVTIGGTLSVAGLGVASFLHGTQADNVLEIEAVLGTGEKVVASRDKNAEIFDSLRSTLGQFGVITGATLRLRKCKPKARTIHLLYDDLGKLMADAATLIREKRVDNMESWCVPATQGFRGRGENRVPFARWFYPLHLTLEHDDGEQPPEAAALAGLQFYERTHTEDWTLKEFLNRLEALFVIWRRSGYWEATHPWMEVILPWNVAQPYIGQVLSQLPPTALGPGGHVLLWPSSGTTSSVPWFMRPDDELVMGFGILPGVPAQYLDIALPKLNLASELSMAMGGKRYLSGLIQFNRDHWKSHYGDRWEEFKALKKRFDPDRVLNPNFVDYD
jgi:cytokinin dehydrogenase